LLVIGTPYKENSVSAIARRAAARSELDTFYTTIYTAGLIPAAKRLPLGRVRAPLMRELLRRSYPGVPAQRVRMLATGWDLALLAFRRLKLNALSSGFMFTSKRRFDEAMARVVPQSDARAVLGMWGSCEATFRSAHRSGRYTVMNYVNSHPSEQNRLMREFGGTPAGHHEFIPDDVIAQVERETAEADLILVPSQFVARQLLARGTPQDRIALEPYGVDLRAFTPPLRPRDYSTGRRLRVLSVAMISYRKGTRDLIAAGRKMTADADFDLLGPVIEPDLLAGLPRNVTYHGILVQSEVIAKMQAADVLVLPSIEDAYPLVIIEAMATGLPVVISDNAGGGESVIPGKTGFVFPVTDVAAFVDYLRQLQAEPELRAEMGAAARSLVENAAPWEAYADRVLDRIGAACGLDPKARAAV
jgi:hypothetical protein